MNNYLFDKDSFGKMHGDKQYANYAFKAVINGIENVYIAEVRNYELANLFIHDIEDPILLILNGGITYFVKEEEKELYRKLFKDVECFIDKYNSRLIN